MLLFLYNLLLPLALLLGFPSWWIKVRKRRGLGTGISERWGLFHEPDALITKGSIYLHAVSVGEAILAKKLITEWLKKAENEYFTLAVSTPTAMQALNGWRPERVAVVYNSIDLSWIVSSFIKRYAPKMVVLMESELWPNLIHQAERCGIPVVVANARLSERSESRYVSLRRWIQPTLEKIKWLGAQTPEDATRWERAGVNSERIQVSGSIKYDPISSVKAPVDPSCQDFLEKLTNGKPIVTAVSTHQGEEKVIAEAIKKAGGFPFLIPRHSERAEEVYADLKESEFAPLLKSEVKQGLEVTQLDLSAYDSFVLNTTGEMMTWLPFADIAVIGKSFLSEGGQNPVEPILLDVPTIVGPHMDNFKELVQELVLQKGLIQTDLNSLSSEIRRILDNCQLAEELQTHSRKVLTQHQGATAHTIASLQRFAKPSSTDHEQ